MSMTMQKVDDRKRLSLPLFYPNYKPDLRRFRISKDAKCFESSSRSSKSQLTHGSNQKSTWQQWEHDSGRPNGTSLKSCLRKSSENGGNANANIKDAKGGDFKDSDSDVTFTATETGNKFSKRKWRATKIGHKDSIDGNRGNENSENIKMKKGCNYTRFRYPLRFHYGSVVQSKPRLISAIPATYQTVSFYSSMPRRQWQIAPDNNMSSKKNRRGTDGKQKHETKASPEQKTENEKDKDSRASSPERELNGVYHIVHETETAEVPDTKTAHIQESITTRKRNKRTAKNQSDCTDDGASEVNDDDVDSSKSLSSKSSHSDRSVESVRETASSTDERNSKKEKSHSDRSVESVRETASSTDERSSKKEKNETESSDEEDLSRSRKKEEKKKKKKKKDIDKNERETEYAADFDGNNSEALTED